MMQNALYGKSAVSKFKSPEFSVRYARKPHFHPHRMEPPTRKIHICAFGIVSGILSLALPMEIATASPIPNAPAISAEIDAKGAKEVVNRLNGAHTEANGPNDWDRVTDQIWLGHSAYIGLATQLAPGTDAGASEDLSIALAHALPLTPNAVLRVMDSRDGPTLGVSRVCGVPFIEDTVKDLPDYIRKAQQAVIGVTTPELQTVKSLCLQRLLEVKNMIMDRKGK